MNSITKLAAAFVALAVLAGCATKVSQDPRLDGPSTLDLTRLASAPTIRRVVAPTKDDVASAAQAAATSAQTGVSDARGLRFLQVSAIPYLRQSPEGAAFLRQSYPRAIARGLPAETCPAAAASPPAAASVDGAATAALGACFAQLERRDANAACGCQLLAVDGLLLTPPSEQSFATGVAAFMIRENGDAPLRLIAESQPNDSGGESILLRSPSALIGVVRLKDEQAAMRLSADPEQIWEGQRNVFGYRRGRLAERVTLTSDKGETIRLLIGVERRDALKAQR